MIAAVCSDRGRAYFAGGELGENEKNQTNSEDSDVVDVYDTYVRCMCLSVARSWRSKFRHEK